MKFTLSTKPLVTAANLVIVNSNVQKFDSKSVMVELTATQNELYINTESYSISSEVKLAGVGTDGDTARIFVDALVFKNLISTLKSTQVELEFTDGALIITSGKSSFSLPQLADNKDGEFVRPAQITEEMSAKANVVDLSKWKFIKEHQLYAKAESYALAVYTFVWMGEHGDVIVGDLNNGIFTHSKVGQLDMNCLLKDTIINLVTSLPENTKIIRQDKTYVLFISADSYEYRSQIIPVFESAETGEYSADSIMEIMQIAPDAIKVDSSEIITVINQSSLLTIDKNPKIEFTVNADGITLKDRRVNAVVAIEGTVDKPYTLQFKPAVLKSLLSNCPETQIEISPRVLEDEVVGIIVHAKDYTAVLAGTEE